MAHADDQRRLDAAPASPRVPLINIEPLRSDPEEQKWLNRVSFENKGRGIPERSH